MSKIRLQWLWIVVGLEVVLIFGLVLWAVAVREPRNSTTEKQEIPTQQTDSEQAYKPPAIELMQIVTGLAFPVAITHTPDPNDKRLFVVEQDGVIRVVAADRTLEKTPFLDITSKVLAGA
jgi:hypothetical protein